MVDSLSCPSYENLYQYTRFCGTAQIPKVHACEEICQEGAIGTINGSVAKRWSCDKLIFYSNHKRSSLS
jgi:hypothetical protein